MDWSYAADMFADWCIDFLQEKVEVKIVVPFKSSEIPAVQLVKG